MSIYLDAHATTPMDPRVLKVWKDTAAREIGNPSSLDHDWGRRADHVIRAARTKVAELLSAKPEEIIFTSGATESNNLAIQGIFRLYRDRGLHLITQVTEHKSVLACFQELEKQGARVTYLKVNKEGQVSIQELQKAIQPETILVSLMMANNEIGTLQPIRKAGQLLKQRGIFFHTDAAQAAGKLLINVQRLGVDLLSLSGHKMYGPKGIGVLYVRKENPRVRIAPLFYGGGQERGLRPGTLNVPAIAALGKACEIAKKEMKPDEKRIGKLRDRLYCTLIRQLDGVFLNGHPVERLYNNLNLSFSGVPSAEMLRALDGKLALSTGSACASQNTEPSYVLTALGQPAERIHSSLRIGLTRFTTQREVDQAAKILVQTVKTCRQKNPGFFKKAPPA